MRDESRKSRVVAIQIVAKWLETADFPDRMMSDVDEDRAFVMELVYGVVRRRRTLEWVSARFARKKQPPFIKASLFVGLYQFMFTDSIAEHAAINETVEAVKSCKKHSAAAGFVNVVLRNYHRQSTDIQNYLLRQSQSI